MLDSPGRKAGAFAFSRTIKRIGVRTNRGQRRLISLFAVCITHAPFASRPYADAMDLGTSPANGAETQARRKLGKEGRCGCRRVAE